MNQEIKDRIITFNKRFGLKTEFITSSDTLGYSLGNTIYINESIEQDYERTNKHELLHFFEETEEFKKIKEELFNANEDKLEEIRNEYELRYFGLYSEEEIKIGAVDNEIAIDLMVDNCSIEYDEGLKVGDKFLGEVEKSLDEKRYLNLSMSANIKNMNLSEWEKLFVLNYYDGKEKKLPTKDKTQGIKQDITSYLDELYNMSEESMRLNPNSPEVIREYESEIKALKARGENTEYLESNKESGLNEIAQRISKQQYEEYKHIVDLIKGLEYEPAFKTLMLRETLTKTYKLDKDKETEERKTIVKTRKLNESIAGHMVLNAQTLEFIYKNINNIQEYQNFANLYFAALEVYKGSVAKESTISLDGVDTFDLGKWLKFEGKHTDEEKYIENAKKLAALVQDTPWCTKQLASEQLADGDFYVFVDNEEKPHIAVRMEGESIGEVRGIKNGNAQELEEEYRDVALSFLENNKEIKNGKEWLEKEEWNKRLIEYKRKIEEGTFTKEDMPQFIEDYFRKDYRSHGGENSNKVALKESLEKIRKVMAEYYECEEKEIAVEDVDFRKYDGEVCPYKVIFGNANFNDSQIIDLGQLTKICGSAVFEDSQVRDLGQLTTIGGDASFRYSKVTNLGQLTTIGGTALFSGSQLTDLGQLTTIGGDADFYESQLTDLGQLTTIGGTALFSGSQLTDLGQLTTIGEHANFFDSQITDLGQLTTIGGYADFRGSQITDLGQLTTIGGYANFRGSQLTDLGQLTTIGGKADFSGSQLTDLGQLTTIGGDVYLDNTTKYNLNNLIDFNSKIHMVEDNGEIVEISLQEYNELYKKYIAKKEKNLTSDDIGKTGFGVDVKECEEAENFFTKQLKKLKKLFNREKGDNR